MDLTVLQGGAIARLRELPSGSVNCCITSPPYFGLRDYGVDGQIGLEASPDEFVAKIVEVFREVRRVLKDDGTCWVNLGDSYCSTAPGTQGDGLNRRGILAGVSGRRAQASKKRRPETPSGMKPKDLIGIPWMVAFALRADGWFLRQDIIWAKPNPMPESVTDRCTKAHEYIFMLSKSARYYFDQDAIKEPLKDASVARLIQDVESQQGSNSLKNGHSGYFDKDGNPLCGMMANKKSVWSVATRGYKEAHFATYPPELIKPCILAGCPVSGVVLDPFAGSGTTGKVALENGRSAILIELNPEYIKLIEKRCRVNLPLFC